MPLQIEHSPLITLGNQQARRLMDYDSLFQVLFLEYAATPPIKQVQDHLAKTGTETLALFTRDRKAFQVVFVGQQNARIEAPLAWVENLWGNLEAERASGVDPLDLSQWVYEQVKAGVESVVPKRPYNNQGLFSEHYLETRLHESPEWAEELEPNRLKLLDLYESKKALLESANEAQTEEEFIRPVLAQLGFAYWVQPTTAAGKRPDYVLYPDEATKNAAVGKKASDEKLYAPALGIVEAKYWGRDLDVKKKSDGRDTLTSAVSPSFQLSEYLSITEREWGILTNGLEWRLYWGKAADKQKRYYRINLQEALQGPDSFRYFWLFFRRDALIEGAKPSFLRQVIEGSEKYGQKVGKELKSVVFEQVFPDLATGFLQYHQNTLKKPLNEDTLQQTYRATLTLLYRLLFLLYAEDRDLLPVSDTLGYQQYSLSRIRRNIADFLDQGRSYSEKSFGLWESLSTLFTFIDQGEASLKVPPYNGGLFKEDRYPFLQSHKVADMFLASALDKLARQEDEDGELRFVDYKYLTVRELGAVYEGLLEFSLKIADTNLAVIKEKDREVYKPKSELKPKEKTVGEVAKGKPYLVNDKKERHASGSYYTPDYIVEYIIGRTLEPIVAKQRQALQKVLNDYNALNKQQDRDPTNARAAQLAELRRQALDTLLDVKVVDPAMGSGHFLVGAVDYLSEHFANLITELKAEPVTDALAEIRYAIKSEMKPFGLELKDEQLSDINLLKRMVMKRCVFGVDFNEMAVELAKLSLWLDAFTVGAPLSFLDHHLRHGNSVLGVSREEFDNWVDKNATYWRSEIESEANSATRKAQELLAVSDITLAEISLSQTLYAQAEEALVPLRRALDVYATGFFAPKTKKGQRPHLLEQARIQLPAIPLAKLTSPPAPLDQSIAFARHHYFFHWEYEFPEVFFGSERNHNPGFDAVVGNPPYVRQEQLGPNKIFFEKTYARVYAGMADLYTYFFDRGLSVLRDGGRLGFICSRQFTRADYGRGLRKLLASKAIKEVTDFGENPVFEGVGTFPAIFVIEQAEPAYPVPFVAVKKADFASLMKAPSEARAESLQRLVRANVQQLLADSLKEQGWTLGSTDENAILSKMEGNGISLGKYVGEINRGVVTGRNAAFFIDKDTRAELIAKDHKSHEIIKPLLVGDDIRHYHANYRNEYLIFTRRGIKINDYPAVKKHLEQYQESLEPKPDDWDESKQGKWPGRKSGDYKWYEIQDTVAYYTEFEQPKIIYPVIAKAPRFYLDVDNYYINDKGFAISKQDWFLLAVLNSRLIFEILKLKLSALGDAQDSGRLELRDTHIQYLPIPHIGSTTDSKGFKKVLDEAKLLYLQGKLTEVLELAEGELAVNRSEIVAEFLGYLAQQMQAMHKEKQQVEGAWVGWVAQSFNGASKLGKEWLAGEWAEQVRALGVRAITERFREKRVRTSPASLAELNKHTQETLDRLRPLYARLEDTDQLIDQIVYRLYGLTVDEIAIIEGKS